MPGRTKCFIAIGVSIMAMAMSTSNTMRITLSDANTQGENRPHAGYVAFIRMVPAPFRRKTGADLLESNIWLSDH